MTEGFLQERDGKIYVGAEDKSRGYFGPIAEVYQEGVWLRVVADKYDNTLMLNFEAVPHLIKALQKLTRKAKQRENSNG